MNGLLECFHSLDLCAQKQTFLLNIQWMGKQWSTEAAHFLSLTSQLKLIYLLGQMSFSFQPVTTWSKKLWNFLWHFFHVSWWLEDPSWTMNNEKDAFDLTLIFYLNFVAKFWKSGSRKSKNLKIVISPLNSFLRNFKLKSCLEYLTSGKYFV